MMQEQFSRTELLLGREAMERLEKSRVAVFGVGGVGGYVCEALARSGVGAFDLVDNDKVSLTNLNRQIIATRKTIGRSKVEVMRERILEINPKADVRVHDCFFLPENADAFPFGEYDYVVDAVDTVTAKIALVMRAQKEDIPIISSMGAGNKLDAAAFRVADIYETKVCPLAKVMRRELKKRGVESLKVVYSEEEPLRPDASRTADIQEKTSLSGDCTESGQQKHTDPAAIEKTDKHTDSAATAKADDRKDACPELSKRDAVRRSIPGSVAFVPSVAGLIIAGEVVKDLSGINPAQQKDGCYTEGSVC